MKLLVLADIYSCECQRDVALAKSLGFNGRVLPIIPNAGEFSTGGSKPRGTKMR
jgi:hypothetical protein